MAKSKWMSKISKMDGAVDPYYNPFARGLRSSSPSVNFTFGNTHLIPEGGIVCIWGLPKGGKSLLCNDIAAQTHKDDPEGIIIKINTEGRESYQMTAKNLQEWGIDLDRYQAFETNTPDVFDFIEKEVIAAAQDGEPIRAVIIDSITNIRGRRGLASESVNDQQRGDQALTIQDGLSRIVSPLRKHKINLIMTAQVRAEQDPQKAKYNPYTMTGGYYIKHAAEYFLMVSPTGAADDKTDLDGNSFENEGLKDMAGNVERTGHKVKVEMKGNSCGPAGRVGKFTVNYQKGIVNVHEEVFTLAVNRKIFQRPNLRTYMYKDHKWTSKGMAVDALRNNTELQEEILKELRRQDIEKDYPKDITNLEFEEVETKEIAAE